MTPARATKPAPPITLAELLARDGDVTKHVGETVATRRPLSWVLDPRLPRPEVLAFDLAKHGAWAFLGSKRRAFGVINAREARIESVWLGELAQAVGDAQNWAEEAGVESGRHPRGLLVVVEDTHLGSAANTPLAFAQITRYGAALAAVCARLRVPMLRIPAGTWQRRIIGKTSREVGKARALAVARARYGAAITTEDMADASLLGTYVRGGR